MKKEFNLSEKIGKDRGIFNDVDVLRVIDVKEFIKMLKEKKGLTIEEIFKKVKDWNEKKWKNWNTTKASKVELIGKDEIDKLAGPKLT